MAVASANSVKTETSQSMDSSPSGRVSDAASESSSSAGLSSATAADPPNSSPNPPRDLEFQPQASQRSEEYRRLFRLPPEEVSHFVFVVVVVLPVVIFNYGSILFYLFVLDI
ncbi:hypothetical protein CsSME_00012303 [Camellia sinensis var. sinensis]